MQQSGSPAHGKAVVKAFCSGGGMLEYSMPTALLLGAASPSTPADMPLRRSALILAAERLGLPAPYSLKTALNVSDKRRLAEKISC